MTVFWYVIAAYFIFAVALLLGYPKHLRKVILDVPEQESTSAVDRLTLLLVIGLITTVVRLFHPSM